jgi:putative transposase
MPEKRQLTDEDAKKIIQDHCHVEHALDLQKFEVYKRNQ